MDHHSGSESFMKFLEQEVNLFDYTVRTLL